MSEANTATECWEILALERPFLLRLACLQLSSAADAEDAVQEALIGAFKAWSSFEGRSSMRSWLTAILRNKIVDSIRRRKPILSLLSGAAAEDYAEFDHLFTADDAWHPDVFIDTVCGETKAKRSRKTQLPRHHLPGAVVARYAADGGRAGAIERASETLRPVPDSQCPVRALVCPVGQLAGARPSIGASAVAAPPPMPRRL